VKEKKSPTLPGLYLPMGKEVELQIIKYFAVESHKLLASFKGVQELTKIIGYSRRTILKFIQFGLVFKFLKPIVINSCEIFNFYIKREENVASFVNNKGSKISFSKLQEIFVFNAITKKLIKICLGMAEAVSYLKVERSTVLRYLLTGKILKGPEGLLIKVSKKNLYPEENSSLVPVSNFITNQKKNYSNFIFNFITQMIEPIQLNIKPIFVFDIIDNTFLGVICSPIVRDDGICPKGKGLDAAAKRFNYSNISLQNIIKKNKTIQNKYILSYIWEG